MIREMLHCSRTGRTVDCLSRTANELIRPLKPVQFQPSPFGGESVTATVKRPQNRAMGRRQISMPSAAFVWFDMRTTPNRQAAKDV